MGRKPQHNDDEQPELIYEDYDADDNMYDNDDDPHDGEDMYDNDELSDEDVSKMFRLHHDRVAATASDIADYDGSIPAYDQSVPAYDGSVAVTDGEIPDYDGSHAAFPEEYYGGSVPVEVPEYGGSETVEEFYGGSEAVFPESTEEHYKTPLNKVNTYKYFVSPLN